MSDRIKKIKIKQSDGTFSDYIPIGADAKNIDTTRGESVQSVIDKTARYYNSIAEMKLDDNIQVGDTCVTLGYYEVNDGGSGTYKIADDSSLEDDGGSVHELNNGLKAKLIIKDNQINVKQFGVYGDGEHDDTNAIQNAIDYIENICIANNQFGLNEPIIQLSGKYKITSTVYFSPFITYNIPGDCFFISYITEEDAPCIHIQYRNNKVLSGNNTQASRWMRGDIITGGCLHIDNAVSFKDANNNGLEIGNREDGGTYTAIARGRIKNISITNFKNGLVINPNHLYVYEFDNIILHANYHDCTFGLTHITSIDSGENITFRNCLFGTTDGYGIYLYCTGLTIKFDNCSFDFNGSGAICMAGNTYLILNGCHIEGAKNTDGTLSSYIGFDNSEQTYRTARICISNLKLVNSGKMLPLFVDSPKGTSKVIVNGINESTTDSSTIKEYNNKNNLFLFSKCLVTEANGVESIERLIDEKRNACIVILDEEDDGEIDALEGSKYLRHIWKNESTSLQEKITTINEEKCILIEPLNSSSLFNITFGNKNYIPIDSLNRNKKFSIGFEYSYNIGSVYSNISVYFYDDENTQIGSETMYSLQMPIIDGWGKPSNIAYINNGINSRKIPDKATKMRIGFAFIASEYCDKLYIRNLQGQWM